MMNYVLVAVGGALGSMARYFCSGLLARYLDETFPWETLVVNVTGSILIGFLAALTAPEGRAFLPEGYRDLLMAGFCGGYTTFSAFSLQTFMLAKEAKLAGAAWNTLLSLVLSLLGVWLGYAGGRALNSLTRG